MSDNVETLVHVCNQDGARWIDLPSFYSLMMDGVHAVNQEKIAQQIITEREKVSQHLALDVLERAGMKVWPWLAASLTAATTSYFLWRGLLTGLGFSSNASKEVGGIFAGAAAFTGFAWLVQLGVKHKFQF